jgi:hypothetical protein
MHIACFGYTSEQRNILLNKEGNDDIIPTYSNKPFNRTKYPVKTFKFNERRIKFLMLFLAFLMKELQMARFGQFEQSKRRSQITLSSIDSYQQRRSKYFYKGKSKRCG